MNKIKDRIEEGLRGICAPLSPGTRVLVIVILVIVFAAVNFYITFRAIYNIGREDKQWERIELPAAIPDTGLQDKEPDGLQKEMENFFNEHFNSKEDDSTDE